MKELKYFRNIIFTDEEVFEFIVKIEDEIAGYVRGNNRSHARKRAIQNLASKKLNRHLAKNDIQKKHLVDFEKEFENKVTLLDKN